ncbi:NIPSNAP family containing protein [Mesorhizobium sp. L-8-10]|uniref:NIPSNAP family protein n=1 Tax=Mesorhizobium sp. L-8-10 TaxID=2744523 RepID=UPI0019290F7E|nr:NIPSNAP family protein [Mesorhizobium sp. L-8-10]BCH34573.1 NIPSNAP family containing protein [Mesorhizobium sp. L-8-10]
MSHPEMSGVGRCAPVVELREYTLRPGGREKLIRLFDREFVETQEETGMNVVGQFRDPDRPDRFVWLRGFESMETRRQALADFYGGPVWAAHKDEANATMLDSDNVLLLQPAWAGAGFDLTGRARGPREDSAPTPDEGSPAVLVRVHHIRQEATEDFATAFRDEAAPLLARLGAPLAGIFVSNHAENTFPRLPVREGENVLATFQEFAGTDALDRHRDATGDDAGWRAIETRLAPYRSRRPEDFRLLPTARSLLGRPTA